MKQIDKSKRLFHPGARGNHPDVQSLRSGAQGLRAGARGFRTDELHGGTCIHVIHVNRNVQTFHRILIFLKKFEYRGVVRDTVTETVESRLEIAVIGMAGKFPGAKNIHQFWDNLKQGKESIDFFSDSQLTAVGVSDEVQIRKQGRENDNRK